MVAALPEQTAMPQKEGEGLVAIALSELERRVAHGVDNGWVSARRQQHLGAPRVVPCCCPVQRCPVAVEVPRVGALATIHSQEILQLQMLTDGRLHRERSQNLQVAVGDHLLIGTAMNFQSNLRSMQMPYIRGIGGAGDDRQSDRFLVIVTIVTCHPANVAHFFQRRCGCTSWRARLEGRRPGCSQPAERCPR